jgi:hypothetical protein
MKVSAVLVTVLAVIGSAAAQNDIDILNFALNLECLEAAFYTCAAYGVELTDAYLGGGGPIVGCQQAALKGPGLAYAQEVANDELDHVRFLRINIGNTSVACPKMDIGPAFATLGAAAYNVTSQTPPFSPYFDVYNFLLGAYVFEDVGVTAYKGAAPLIQNKNILGAAAKILATEGYHAGLIRNQLAQNSFIPLQQSTTVGTFANKISALRATLSGAADETPLISANGTPNIVTADANAIAFSRTPQQVLAIVYGTGDAKKPGLFFPEGVNGYFSPRNLNNGK